MKFDYIEIGTSDFDLLCVKNEGKKGISVEPVRYYFERIPNIEGNTKVHAAISRVCRVCDVYYLPPDVIKAEKLPNWVRGCNSIDTPHPTVRKLLGGRHDDLIIKEQVECFSWDVFAERYEIEEVDRIQIDAEGHESLILLGLFEYCEKSGMRPREIVFEYNELSEKQDMDKIIDKFLGLGYRGDFTTRNDFKLVYGQV